MPEYSYLPPPPIPPAPPTPPAPKFIINRSCEKVCKLATFTPNGGSASGGGGGVGGGPGMVYDIAVVGTPQHPPEDGDGSEGVGGVSVD